jgi:hypothetical protein
MNCHTAVKILLGRSHLHRQPESLHHLIDTLAQDVQADHLLLWPDTHNLKLRRLLLLLLWWEDVKEHVTELRMVGFYILLAILLYSLRFGEAGGADLGVCKDDGGDLVVLEPVVFELRRSKEAVAELAAGGDSDGRQLSLSGHVAEGVDAWDGRVLVFVDDDVATVLELEVRLQVLEAHPSSLWASADGPKELVALELRAIVGDDFELFVRRVGDGGSSFELDDFFDAWMLFVDSDPSFFVMFCHRLLDHGVEFAEEGSAADEHVGFDAEGVHDAGELDRDIACADEDYFLRQGLDGEEVVRGDAVFSTLDVGGLHGVAASGDADVWCRDRDLAAAILERNFHVVLVNEGSRAVDEFDALLLPIGLVYTVEDFYSGCALVDELAEVERDVLGDVVAVMLAILQVLVYCRHVVRHLLWHTSRKQMSARQGCLCSAFEFQTRH